MSTWPFRQDRDQKEWTGAGTHPFTKATTSPNDHFRLRPSGGRVRESLLYVKFIYIPEMMTSFLITLKTFFISLSVFPSDWNQDFSR